MLVRIAVASLEVFEVEDAVTNLVDSWTDIHCLSGVGG